ncbi:MULTISPECIES: L-aspartate oxidase [unclassified Microbacterium]|uniref:L-aspartate oxidase n=1 Tax=unclassified Microbacterium TaxID=2609290 RepID=UPI000AEEBFEC|nr:MULTISPECIES: L-aspartate oxidase [unclassified Microbacterium]
MTLRQAHSGAARVVVVGSGIAGLIAALHAADGGCRVTLVTKDVLEHANTRYAQGGIAGVMFDDDSAAAHIHDTLVAGAGLSDPTAVQVLVDEGPDRIRELIELGVAFDRAADGALVQGLEAAHSYPRILHAGGDATGTVIEKALVTRLRGSAVEVIEHAFLIDLVCEDGRVVGVELLVGDDPSAGAGIIGERVRIDADAVVLATGGAGQLYAHTTNPPVATGDGIAAALRAGAAVTDLEFVQFHPTVLPGEGEVAPFLVSEAVRGEGAVLRDEQGRRFMLDVHPDAELAPRDVVARAIADVMAAQDGRPVLLDATALGPEGKAPSAKRTAAFLARRFPTIDAAVRDRGWDWAREPIPVTPAAHYLMGGVSTDLFGRTSLPGLYAVGEVARTGVHGANRLASNSLLEGAVFGARAGDVVAADVASGAWAGPAAEATRAVGQAPPDRQLASVRAPFTRAGLQELMWADAGLVRDGVGLEHAASVIAAWRGQARTPVTEAEFEDENLLQVAAAVVAAALARPESVGAHARRDSATATIQELSPARAPSRPESGNDTQDLLSYCGDAPATDPRATAHAPQEAAAC